MSADAGQFVPVERLGAVLVAAGLDERWRDPQVSLIAGGKSNLTFELSSPAGELILRRPPSGSLLPTAHDMTREARVQRALGGTDVPVPEIVLVEESGDALGVPFYVMTKVSGHVIRDQLPVGYAREPAERRALGDALVDVLVDLHAVEPGAVGLAEFGRPTGFLARQVRRWHTQWESSRDADVPAVDELARELQARLPTSPAPTIVHGDFRLDNCLMNLHDPATVEAVLDWEMSSLGDPLTDVGLLLFYWREHGEPSSSLTPAVTDLAGFPTRRELVQRYATRTGRTLEGIGYYEAFAHFKVAVIAQGIAARVKAGSMAGQDFGDLSDEVVRIADRGLAAIARSS